MMAKKKSTTNIRLSQMCQTKAPGFKHWDQSCPFPLINSLIPVVFNIDWSLCLRWFHLALQEGIPRDAFFWTSRLVSVTSVSIAFHLSSVIIPSGPCPLKLALGVTNDTLVNSLTLPTMRPSYPSYPWAGYLLNALKGRWGPPKTKFRALAF